MWMIESNIEMWERFESQTASVGNWWKSFYSLEPDLNFMTLHLVDASGILCRFDEECLRIWRSMGSQMRGNGSISTQFVSHYRTYERTMNEISWPYKWTKRRHFDNWHWPLVWLELYCSYTRSCMMDRQTHLIQFHLQFWQNIS